MLAQARTLWSALYDLFADSGFSMAGAVAFSFVLALFPFCIFLGAFAGYFGGEQLAKAAVEQLFNVVPPAVAQVLEPEVMAVMGRSRFGLLTFGALIALFFATSAVESLRAALNVAYREKETKSYPACLFQSMVLVLLSALGMLAIAWGVVAGPTLMSKIKPKWLLWLADQTWTALIIRYVIVISIIGAQLLTYHLWLAAGRRRLMDVWPGVALSMLLWILAAKLFGNWLQFNDYSRFYAGLTSLMSALIFFQVTAIVIILGAELNRAMITLRQRREENLSHSADAALLPDESV
jgi:membrane protein